MHNLRKISSNHTRFTDPVRRCFGFIRFVRKILRLSSSGAEIRYIRRKFRKKKIIQKNYKEILRIL